MGDGVGGDFGGLVEERRAVGSAELRRGRVLDGRIGPLRDETGRAAGTERIRFAFFLKDIS
jgi:hypothetical protein